MTEKYFDQKHLRNIFFRMIIIVVTFFYFIVLLKTYLQIFIPAGTFFSLNSGTFELNYCIILIAMLPIIGLPLKANDITDYLIWWFYLLLFAPSILLSSSVLGEDNWGMVFILTIGFVVMLIFARIKPIKIQNINLDWIFWALIILFWLLMNAYLVINHGINIKFVSLGDVYLVRFEYREIVGLLTDYFVNWLGNVLNVFFLIYGIYHHKIRIIIPLVILSQLNLYGLTAYKSLLLPLFIVPLLIVVKQHQLRKFLPYMTFVFLGILLILVAFGSKGDLLALSLADRIFLAPGILNALYFKYFSLHPLALLGHSVFSGIVDYPYSTTPDFLVGQEYFHEGVRANAFVFADAFANFGMIGYIIAGIGLGICLLCIKTVSYKHNSRVAFAIFLMPAVSLMNAPLQTTLLTHGLGLAIILAFFAPKIK